MKPLEIFALDGIGEITTGDDLAVIIGDALAQSTMGLLDGDVLVVTSKIVSKAEGRIRSLSKRDQALDEESFGEIAQRDQTRIVRTRHGFVMATAGIDASNTAQGTIVLLPIDPDHSARLLREALQKRFNIRIGIVISDTFGRPWRQGLTDAAVGAAGVVTLDDHRGRTDSQGRTLEQTVVATADELAAAADLVKGKAANYPVAIVRNSQAVTEEHGAGAGQIVRPLNEDLFERGSEQARQMGQQEAVSLRRTVRSWSDRPVKHELISQCVAAAITAPAPHHSTPWRFIHVTSQQTRDRLLTTMAHRWRDDLRADGLASSAIEERIGRGDILSRCPELVIPVLVFENHHDYPDERRSLAERDMFVLSVGAAVQSFMISAAAVELGTAWVSSTLFCTSDVQTVLDLPSSWQTMGAIAVGYPEQAPQTRICRDAAEFLIQK